MKSEESSTAVHFLCFFIKQTLLTFYYQYKFITNVKSFDKYLRMWKIMLNFALNTNIALSFTTN